MRFNIIVFLPGFPGRILEISWTHFSLHFSCLLSIFLHIDVAVSSDTCMKSQERFFIPNYRCRIDRCLGRMWSCRCPSVIPTCVNNRNVTRTPEPILTKVTVSCYQRPSERDISQIPRISNTNIKAESVFLKRGMLVMPLEAISTGSLQSVLQTLQACSLLLC